MVTINSMDPTSFAIDADAYAQLVDADLVEVCELHSHGYLIEIISVATDTNLVDSGVFEGLLIAAGDIEGNFETAGTFNVTCIGDGFKRVGAQQYFAIEYSDDEKRTRDEAIAFAAWLLMKREKTPISV